MTRNIPGPAGHIPERTCIGCRKVTGKSELVRLVRVKDRVEVDEESRKPGRGAYVCLTEECWSAAVRNGRVERTLHITLSGDNIERLTEAGAAIRAKRAAKRNIERE